MNLNSLASLQTQFYEATIEALQQLKLLSPSEKEVEALVEQLLKKEDLLLPQNHRKKLLDQVVFSITGLGPLEFLLREDEVSEIMVNGTETIYIERQGKVMKTEYSFLSQEHLIQVINRIVGPLGRRIDESTPMVDARLPDGSRVNAIIPPLSLIGPVLTIRKFPKKVFQIEDLLSYKSISPDMADFLCACVESKQNILISGGTGAGKTSTLNACAGMIPRGERIITIEDAAEIRIDHPHLVSLEARASNVEGKGSVPIRALVKNALRMRPDRIVVGEIREGEAIDMLQAMNTGHQGSLTTVHANAPLESLFRIETMVLMGGIDMPLSAIRPQVIQAIDVIVQQNRLSDGRRIMTEIALVEKRLNSESYMVHPVFRYNPKTEEFMKVKRLPFDHFELETHSNIKSLFIRPNVS